MRLVLCSEVCSGGPPFTSVAARSESSGLLNRFSRLCKIHNPNQILLPAKDLHRF